MNIYDKSSFWLLTPSERVTIILEDSANEDEFTKSCIKQAIDNEPIKTYDDQIDKDFEF